MICDSCQGIHTYYCYSCYYCNLGKCPLCNPCKCRFQSENNCLVKCGECNHIIHKTKCPCDYCLVECIEWPNGRLCEFCNPPIQIVNIKSCLNSVQILLDYLVYCQECHEFTWNDNSEIKHRRHLKLERKSTIINLLKTKYPQIPFK